MWLCANPLQFEVFHVILKLPNDRSDTLHKTAISLKKLKDVSKKLSPSLKDSGFTFSKKTLDMVEAIKDLGTPNADKWKDDDLSSLIEAFVIMHNPIPVGQGKFDFFGTKSESANGTFLTFAVVHMHH